MPRRTLNAVQAIQWGQHALFGALFTAGVLSLSLTAAWSLPAAVSAAAVGAWYLIGMAIAGRYERMPGANRVSWQGVSWLIVLVALWVAAALLGRPFIWLSFSIFLLCLLLLPTVLGVAAVVLITVFVVTTEFILYPNLDPMAAAGGPTMGAIVALGIAWGYRTIVRESAERARLINELTEARDDLVALQDTLARTQREAGALGERARLAREIHDTLAQGFSSIVLLARAGQAQARPEERQLLADIAATAGENLAEARRVVHALAPADLEQAPLSDALSRQVRRLADQTGIVADLAVDGDPVTLPTHVEVALLRVLQGALSNVRRHAGAHRVHVTLTYEPDEVRLDVVDDGRGFVVSEARTRPDGSGFGLRSIRERIAGIGGQVGIESAPGEGTALVATVPLTGPSRPDQP